MFLLYLNNKIQKGMIISGINKIIMFENQIKLLFSYFRMHGKYSSIIALEDNLNSNKFVHVLNRSFKNLLKVCFYHRHIAQGAK